MLIQIVVQGSAALFCKYMSVSMTSTWLVVINLVTSALTIALFVWRRWSPFSRDYMQRRQWGVFMWSALMALGVVAPMQLLTETLGLTMPKQTEQLLVQILSNDWGFLALAVAVPLAEEMVFRGAVLRVLLRHFGTRRCWWPIVLSAVLFGAAHGNGVQFVNATLMGLLLGWLYWRTGSIAPGVLFHAVNNSVALVTFRFMPGTHDMTLTEFFGGDTVRLSLFIVCSFCVFLPSLWQVWRCTK